MRKFSRLMKALSAGACAMALAACGKSQDQQTYVIPDEGLKVDAKKIDARATTLRLADAAYSKGDYGMAAQLYYRASELQPDDATVMVKLGFALFKTGGAADAEKIFRTALAKDPKNAEAQRGLAHSLVMQGRAKEALPIYRQAIASSTTPDARVYSGLGAALDMVGKHGEARTAYMTGLKLEPRDFGLRNNLALSYAMSGQTSKARAIFAELSQEGAGTSSMERLSALKSILASAPRPERQGAKEVPAPVAETGDELDVAEVPAPVSRAPLSRKAYADVPFADSGEGEIFIRTGGASLAAARDGLGVPAMSFRSEADTPDAAAAEVIALLAQADRGPRFVWQLARRPDAG